MKDLSYSSLAFLDTSAVREPLHTRAHMSVTCIGSSQQNHPYLKANWKVVLRAPCAGTHVRGMLRERISP